MSCPIGVESRVLCVVQGAAARWRNARSDFAVVDECEACAGIWLDAGDGNPAWLSRAAQERFAPNRPAREPATAPEPRCPRCEQISASSSSRERGCSGAPRATVCSSIASRSQSSLPDHPRRHETLVVSSRGSGRSFSARTSRMLDLPKGTVEPRLPHRMSPISFRRDSPPRIAPKRAARRNRSFTRGFGANENHGRAAPSMPRVLARW